MELVLVLRTDRSASRRRTSLRATLLMPLVLAAGCGVEESETLRFSQGATDVEVTFHGEVTDADLFGPSGSLLDRVHPLDANGQRKGNPTDTRPGWLHFEYQLDGERREVLVAKRPLMNAVSWDDVARAGAALGDGSLLSAGSVQSVQGARVKDAVGNEYQVRLPTCGRSTLSDLSEWNLLIGAVHRGDMDFVGTRYGWIGKPYGDDDLKVGYHGSLTWCQDSLRGERVARGYFFVSRFHAGGSDLRTDRLQWRPVLERIKAVPKPLPRYFDDDPSAPIQWSPSRRVGFAGAVSNSSLFGPGISIGEMIPVEGGKFFEKGQPDWLRFVSGGRQLLVAARPIRLSVSWNAIAQAGAALGDGSSVRVGWRTYRQDAEVKTLDGRRYRVRLLGCGRSTLDLSSEWNALIGGVHQGDGDFVPFPQGVYGWSTPAMDNQTINVGPLFGGSSWCRDRLQRDGKTHGVNRGYMTVSRFHATEVAFDGDGFGWRPVLEAIP
jgi:hypothetical protein